MRQLISLFAWTTALLASCPAMAQSGALGIGRAKDGDSLMVGDKEARLFGIDAPELHQTCQRNGTSWSCGGEAAERLASFVNGKPVRCDSVGTDKYGRTLARCSVGSMDLNRAMVALGYAVAFRHYSTDYVSAEETAKAYRRGLWASTFTMPSDYRHAEKPDLSGPVIIRPNSPKVSRSRAPSPAAHAGSCNIKGNRNRKGQWSYHLPGMPYYEQTRPEEIFCTEQQAQAAGYRRAIVR